MKRNNVLLDQAINSTSLNFDGMPQGETVSFACDGDVTIAWWIDTKGNYDTTNAETMEAGAGVIGPCPHSKCRLTTAGSVNVRLTKENRK